MLKSETLLASNAKVSMGTVNDVNDIAIVDTARSITYNLPSDFYLYVRSVSKVTSTYAFKSTAGAADNPIRIIPNMLSSQNDVWKLIETPHDSLRILRYPAAILNTDRTISVIYDRYTTVEGIKLIYYKQPQHFDLMDSIPCELPMDAFDDLVSGAVDLYVQYAAGAEARKRQMQKAQQQQNKRNNEDEE